MAESSKKVAKKKVAKKSTSPKGALPPVGSSERKAMVLRGEIKE